jgi:hypothetical protein
MFSSNNLLSNHVYKFEGTYILFYSILFQVAAAEANVPDPPPSPSSPLRPPALSLLLALAALLFLTSNTHARYIQFLLKGH